MERTNRSRLAWTAAALAAVALVVWWFGRAVRMDEEPEHRSPPVASPAEPATPRAPRHRDAATPEPPAPSAAETKPPDAEKTSADETYPFTVNVLHADGTPAAGATVQLLDPTAEGDNVVARATADDKGVASLRPPDAEVRVAAWLGAEAAATGELIALKDRHEITVRLGPSMTVRGRVYRGEATPEPGAEVELTASPWRKSDFGLTLRTVSDAGGVFEFPPIAKDGIDPLNPPGVEATAKDMARGFTETDLDGPDAEIAVHLVPGFAIRAHFVDADGKPVAAELITAGARTYRATADADGRVTLRAPEAAYRFIARRPTSLIVTPSSGTVPPDVTPWRVGRTLGQRAGGAHGDVDLGDVVFATGRPLAGRVADEQGNPVAAAQVILFLTNTEIASVVTGDDGRFVLPEVSDEPHRLYVYAVDPEHPDDDSKRTTVDGVRGGGPELRIVVGESPSIAFRFLAGGERTPVAAADIRIKAKLHGTDKDTVGTQGIGEPTSTFAFGVPSPGSYDVDVEVGGYEPQHLECIEVVAGRRTSLDLLLRKKRD
jgi:hypothetical protein